MGTAEITRKRATEQNDGDIFEKEEERQLVIGYEEEQRTKTS